MDRRAGKSAASIASIARRSREEILLHRHAAAHRQRLAARRPRLLLHPHRRRRAVPAHARPRSVLSDGVGRQRPAHRAPGAELLRRAVRSVAAVRPGRSSRPTSPASSRCRSHGRTSSSSATGSPSKTRRSFEHLWRHLGLSVDWSMTYATIDQRAQRVSQLAFLRLLRARPRVSAGSADAVGHGLPYRGGAGGARGSRAAGRLPSHPLRASRRRTAYVEIETTRRS